MRRTITALFLIVVWLCFATVGWGAEIKLKKGTLKRVVVKEKLKYKFPPYLLKIAWPDLSVTISGPATAIAGDSIPLDISVMNNGHFECKGSKDATPGYRVDIIFSQDNVIPMQPGIHPVYAGFTAEDFVEDQLMTGGRISNTWTIPKNAAVAYSLTTEIPLNTAPGDYFIAAVADPFKSISELNEGNNIATFPITIIAAEPSAVQPPHGVGLWVMPYAIGNTPINVIKPSGLVDYKDGNSTYNMVDAPFGRTLGFRLGYANVIPMPQIKYYRWLYKKDGTTNYLEFEDSVNVHYVRDEGGVISFPLYNLGPKNVNSMKLFEFRPHSPPNESPVADTYWPTAQWMGDIYSGYLRSHTLPNGKYTIKVEIYNNAGVQVMPGVTHKFIVPDGKDSVGTILTRPAVPAEIHNGGFTFPLHIDNNTCSAYISAPAIGTTTASDECGFLLYNSKTNNVKIAFTAAHPNGYAMFRFRTVRGIYNAFPPVVGEVFATSVSPFAGNGAGFFWNDFTVSTLLSSACPDKAAFSENLYVYAKATTGWGHRITAYDASFVRAFALAPVMLY